jgi:hypothetical protein
MASRDACREFCRFVFGRFIAMIFCGQTLLEAEHRMECIRHRSPDATPHDQEADLLTPFVDTTVKGTILWHE